MQYDCINLCKLADLNLERSSPPPLCFFSRILEYFFDLWVCFMCDTALEVSNIHSTHEPHYSSSKIYIHDTEKRWLCFREVFRVEWLGFLSLYLCIVLLEIFEGSLTKKRHHHTPPDKAPSPKESSRNRDSIRPSLRARNSTQKHRRRHHCYYYVSYIRVLIHNIMGLIYYEYSLKECVVS